MFSCLKTCEITTEKRKYPTNKMGEKKGTNSK